MYSFAEIRTVHLELTERCNAACPQCPRRIDGGMMNPNLKGAELTLAGVKRILPAAFVAQLRKVFMCGNYGDPAAAHETLEIAGYFRESSANLKIGLHTNGSLRSGVWWARLAEIIGSNGYVRFAIDGLEDTNSIYRRNTDWQKIIKNAEQYIAAGGRAEWDFIVFEHNEHQVEAARSLAENMGFKAFNVKKTARFLRRDTMSAPPTAVRSTNGALVGTISAPANVDYRNEFLTSLQKKEEMHSSFNNYLAQTPIHCKAQAEKSAYISAEGFALPCCWTASMLRNPTSSETRQFAAALPDAETKSALSAQNLHEIVSSDFFQREIPERWNSGHAQRLQVCARVCGHG